MKNTFARLSAAVIISAFVMTPVLASAETASSTDDQIKSLMEQIRSLQQQVTTLLKARGDGMGTTTPPRWGNATSTDGMMKRPCPAFIRDLRRGSQGDDVKELQQHLAENMPDAFSDDKVTGFFGPMTEKALMKFQEKLGVGATGFFGPKSRGEFGKRCGQMGGMMGGMMGSSTPPRPDWKMGSSTRPWGDDGRMRPPMGSSTPGMMWNDDQQGDDGHPKSPKPMGPPMPLPPPTADGQQH